MKDLQLAFYGDDFTGSTDVLEALSLAGWKTLLFLEPPGPQELASFDGLDAIGIAGNSRSWPPETMELRLAPVFERIRALSPRMVHYKICSTFDSSPEVGSIGRALEIGRRVFGARLVPILAAAPILGRYCAFGHLFARSGLDSPVFRLDRHPTMSRHPVTPMRESDLLLHLSRQTSVAASLFDLSELNRPDVEQNFRSRLASHDGALLFDLVDGHQLATIGNLLRLAAEESRPLFLIGSSGIEYALTAAAASPLSRPQPSRVDQMLVVSGSCSPVSDRQMTWAVENGYREIPLDPAALLTSGGALAHEAATEALRLLDRGASVLLHTCRGPEDPRLASGKACLRSAQGGEGGEPLGEQLALLLHEILSRRPVPRVMVIGGDTSAYTGLRLGIRYLEFVAPIEPGGPLCRAAGAGPADGASIVFKGGQVGSVDYLGKAQGL
jgi:uncharacterized protein YgbK (DUF1537 family)